MGQPGAAGDATAVVTIEQVLDGLRTRGKRLPLALAGMLYSAAVRLAVARPVALRPNLLVLDDEQGLVLAPSAGPGRPDRPGYVAPEVAAGTARPDEPRALVYAAGALGYELLTGRTPPQPPRSVGPELSGPFAAMVRSALSANRGERPPGLPALRVGLETEEAPLPAEHERARFVSLLTRFRAAALSAPPAAASAPPVARTASVPPPPPPDADEAPEAVSAVLSPPADTTPALPDAGLKIASLEKSVQTSQVEMARLEEAMLEMRSAAAERERAAQDLLAIRTEQERKIASLGKREEDLVARLASLETTVRASQIGPPRRPSRWPLAAAAGGGAILALVLVLVLGGRTPAPQPAPREEPAPQAAAQPPEPVAQPPQAVPAPPPAAVPAPAPAQTAPPAAPAPEAVQETPPPPAPAARPTPPTPPAPKPAAARPAPTAKSKVKQEVEKGDKALRKGQMDEAQAAFQRALAADPKAAEAVRGLAMVNMTQGKEQEAKALYERYLQLAPSAPDAARIRKVVQSLSAQ